MDKTVSQDKAVLVNIWKGLHINKVIEKESCDVWDGLEEIRDIITKFAPQGPTSHRFEETKVEYLYEEMMGVEWAKFSLTIVTPMCHHDHLSNYTPHYMLHGYKNNIRRKLNQVLTNQTIIPCFLNHKVSMVTMDAKPHLQHG